MKTATDYLAEIAALQKKLRVANAYGQKMTERAMNLETQVADCSESYAIVRLQRDAAWADIKWRSAMYEAIHNLLEMKGKPENVTVMGEIRRLKRLEVEGKKQKSMDCQESRMRELEETN